MKYRNVKTGVEVEVPSPVNSPLWEEVKPQKTKQKEEKGGKDEKRKADSQKNKKE